MNDSSTALPQADAGEIGVDQRDCQHVRMSVVDAANKLFAP